MSHRGGWGWLDIVPDLEAFTPFGPRLPSTSSHWESGGFLSELSEWLAHVVGEPRSLEPHKIRAWAAVWRAETDQGVFYAKQNCPAQRFEAALLAELAELVPQRVVPVAAVDLERGLLVTPDQGAVLAETAGDDLDTWCRVVSAGAALQREVAPHVDRLASTGLNTLEPSGTTAYVEHRLSELAGIDAADPRAMALADREAVRAHLPVIERWVEQVADLGLPTTLLHNDLHGHNVFDRGGELRFFDFADALLTEPLGALLIPINSLAYRLEAGPDDPRLARVAEAGLEVWSDLAPLAELRAALPAALQLARLGRVESWVRCLAPMTDAELVEWGDGASYWLSSLLHEPPPFGHLAD